MGMRQEKQGEEKGNSGQERRTGQGAVSLQPLQVRTLVLLFHLFSYLSAPTSSLFSVISCFPSSNENSFCPMKSHNHLRGERGYGREKEEEKGQGV